MNIQAVTLTGKSVRLDPLSLDHLDRLCAVGLDEELWRFSVIQVRNRTDLEHYVRTVYPRLRRARLHAGRIQDRPAE
jgi:hypothetical protein